MRDSRLEALVPFVHSEIPFALRIDEVIDVDEKKHFMGCLLIYLQFLCTFLSESMAAPINQGLG